MLRRFELFRRPLTRIVAQEGVKALTDCRSGTRERFVRARGEKLTLSATVRNIRAKAGDSLAFAVLGIAAATILGEDAQEGPKARADSLTATYFPVAGLNRQST